MIAGSGSMGVGFSVEGNIQVPDSAKVAEVQSYLETKAPASFSEIIALAIEELLVDISLSISPDNANNRTAVETALVGLLGRINPSTIVNNSVLRVADIEREVNLLSGITLGTLSQPVANIIMPFNTVPVLGSLTFT
jgi:hypothetical protein